MFSKRYCQANTVVVTADLLILSDMSFPKTQQDTPSVTLAGVANKPRVVSSGELEVHEHSEMLQAEQRFYCRPCVHRLFITHRDLHGIFDMIHLTSTYHGLSDPTPARE